MPIYEFECLVGHRSEQIVLSHYLPNDILCPIIEKEIRCGLPAERVWSKPANINIGKPTIIFRNAKDPNDVQVATSSSDVAPYGFVKEELRNPIERSKFEKERQQSLDNKNELITESIKQRDNETRKNRHDEINANMSKLPDDGTQALMKFAMQRTRNKKERIKKSNVRLDINHIDSSNLVK